LILKSEEALIQHLQVVLSAFQVRFLG
jgi:hypothetical protein